MQNEISSYNKVRPLKYLTLKDWQKTQKKNASPHTTSKYSLWVTLGQSLKLSNTRDQPVHEFKKTIVIILKNVSMIIP